MDSRAAVLGAVDSAVEESGAAEGVAAEVRDDMEAEQGAVVPALDVADGIPAVAPDEVA